MNNDVKAGDKIFHKVYGWEIVISEGNSIEVIFAENRNKKLPYRWVVGRQIEGDIVGGLFFHRIKN